MNSKTWTLNNVTTEGGPKGLSLNETENKSVESQCKYLLTHLDPRRRRLIYRKIFVQTTNRPSRKAVSGKRSLDSAYFCEHPRQSSLSVNHFLFGCYPVCLSRLPRESLETEQREVFVSQKWWFTAVGEGPDECTNVF